MNLKRIWIIFAKEFTDNLRDRRSLFSTLSSTLIGPVIVVAMIVVLGKTLFQDSFERPLEIPIVGAEHAPSLIQFLEQNNVQILPGPEDPETEVRNGFLNLVLIIPATYGEDFTAGRPAAVQLVIDASRQSAMADVERARNLISNYSATVGNLRLLARGVSPAVTHAVALERIDVSTPEGQANIFLSMMPYFIVLIVFTGGMHVVIDTTAGERERGSLEPLLINPALRGEFVLGKLAAAIPYSIFAVLLTLTAFAVAFNLVPLEEYIGFQLSISPRALVGIFLVALPMVLLASALQMVIVAYTRSFKEAQTYTAFLPLIPALPGILVGMLPIRITLWQMAIPTFGQQLLINQFMRGEPVNPLHVVVSVISTLVLAILITLLAIRLYQRERLILGVK